VKLKLAIVLLAGLVPFSQGRVDRALGERRGAEEALYIWSGAFIKRLCPGFENLMADIYWLRTVQYFGGQRAFAANKRYELLEPLTNITVTLDPRFEIAYQYGAIFLSEPHPMGAGQPEKGVALLRRGAAAAGSWRLKQFEGYFTLAFLHDFRGAADILLEASRMPGAAYWLKTLAADVLTRAGDRDVARRIWRHMWEQAQPGSIRANAEFNLMQLDALDGRDGLQAEVSSFRSRTGRFPHSLGELPPVAARTLSITDPSGVPFEYDGTSGTVSISKRSILWRIPREHL
jgi:hypothetical protein